MVVIKLEASLTILQEGIGLLRLLYNRRQNSLVQVIQPTAFYVICAQGSTV